MGAAILATATRNADIILGGIALSLAYLTKQVGMFGGGAIAVAWLALLAGSGVGRRRWVRSAGLLAASGLALPIAFELVKLLALGPAGYVDLKRAEVQEAGLPGGHASTDIIATVRTLLDDSYQGWVTLAGLALISIGLVLVARRGAGTPEQRRRVARGTWLWVLLWAGSAGQLVHVAWSRSEWTRYLWLSAMLAVVACVAPMVMLTSRVRGTVLALLVGVVALTVVTRPPSADPFAPPPGHVDRSAIVAWLDARPGMPYVGMGWTQVNDIAFARTDEGTWSARDPRAWAPAPFAMVINEDFVLPTERASALYTTTTRTCEPQLTDQLTTRRLLACGDAFWQSYLGDAAVLGPEGGLLDPLTSAEEYQVGPDVSVSTTPDAPPGQAGPSVRLTATGVPSTAFRTATRNVTMDLSAVPDDAELRFWARASTKDHLGAAYLLLLSPDGYAPMGAIPTAAGQWEEHRIRKGDVGVSPGFDWSKVTNIVLRVDGGDAPYDGALDWWGLRIGG